jgi:hypothetical protein
MNQPIWSASVITYFYTENIFLGVLILLNISDSALLPLFKYILLWQFVCQNFQKYQKNVLLEKIPKDFPNFLLFVVLYNTISFIFNNETEKLLFHRVQKVIFTWNLLKYCMFRLKNSKKIGVHCMRYGVKALKMNGFSHKLLKTLKKMEPINQQSWIRIRIHIRS